MAYTCKVSRHEPGGALLGVAPEKLRQMDLADAVAGRAVLGKTAYKARIRSILKTKKAQQVAAAHAASLRKVCKEVVAKKGAASSG